MAFGTTEQRMHHRWRTPYMGIRRRNQWCVAVEKGLLSVVGQHLPAARGQLRAVLLQTCQDGEIALVHHDTAETLDVASACLLLFRRTATLLLSDGAGRNRYGQQRERKENFSHGVLSLWENPASEDRLAYRGGVHSRRI